MFSRELIERAIPNAIGRQWTDIVKTYDAHPFNLLAAFEVFEKWVELDAQGVPLTARGLHITYDQLANAYKAVFFLDSPGFKAADFFKAIVAMVHPDHSYEYLTPLLLDCLTFETFLNTDGTLAISQETHERWLVDQPVYKNIMAAVGIDLGTPALGSLFFDPFTDRETRMVLYKAASRFYPVECFREYANAPNTGAAVKALSSTDVDKMSDAYADAAEEGLAKYYSQDIVNYIHKVFTWHSLPWFFECVVIRSREKILANWDKFTPQEQVVLVGQYTINGPFITAVNPVSHVPIHELHHINKVLDPFEDITLQVFKFLSVFNFNAWDLSATNLVRWIEACPSMVDKVMIAKDAAMCLTNIPEHADTVQAIQGMFPLILLWAAIFPMGLFQKLLDDYLEANPRVLGVPIAEDGSVFPLPSLCDPRFLQNLRALDDKLKGRIAGIHLEACMMYVGLIDVFAESLRAHPIAVIPKRLDLQCLKRGIREHWITTEALHGLLLGMFNRGSKMRNGCDWTGPAMRILTMVVNEGRGDIVNYLVHRHPLPPGDAMIAKIAKLK